MPVYRIDKILSDMAIASRREAKSYIKAGRVAVNGSIIDRPETKCNTETDLITVDGNTVHYRKFAYFMLNKPSGVVCAVEDRREKTVIDLLDEEHRRLGLFPVGRLDKDTEGLLILTNDGDFCHRLTSPKHGIIKTYLLETGNKIDKSAKEMFLKGLVLDDGTKCLPAELEIIGPMSAHLSISEGKYHQVKRMMAKVGSPVKYLKRISIGGLRLDESLKPGMYREINQKERINIEKNAK